MKVMPSTGFKLQPNLDDIKTIIWIRIFLATRRMDAMPRMYTVQAYCVCSVDCTLPVCLYMYTVHLHPVV
jgi:hypothetical protein